MIESLFEEIPRIPDEDPRNEELSENLASQKEDADSFFLSALGTVQKIINWKIKSPSGDEADDISQGALLRLWQWWKKYKEKSRGMSPQEWDDFTARTAFNEINRHFKKQRLRSEVTLDACSDLAAVESPEGQTKVEEMSLTRASWQEICNMSLRHRRSILFHSQKFHFFLLSSGVEEEEIAAGLEISIECWMNASKHLPLRDAEIAELIKAEDQRKRTGSKSRSIKKARFEARKKMRKVTDK